MVKPAALTDEEWRAACEAVHVAGMEAPEQRDWYLDGVSRKRGDKAAQELRVMVWEILRKRVKE